MTTAYRAGPSRRVLLAFPLLIAGAVGWNVVAGSLSARQWILGPFAGFALWTLVEYVVHRWLFHIVPESPWLLQRQQHLAHHASPTDTAFFVIPLWLSLPIAGLVWAVLRLATATWAEAALVLTGAMTGYVAYELIHYEIHLGRGRGRLQRFWRRHHLYHHLTDDTRCFGFTTSFWDIVFGTARPRRARRRESRLRGIGAE